MFSSLRHPFFLFSALTLLLSNQLSAAQAAVNDMQSQAFGLYSAGYVPANNSDATAEQDEPTHGAVGTGHSLWWQWRGDTGEHTITLRPYHPGLSFVLVVYSVDGEGTLSEQAKVQAQDMTPESVRFNAESGIDYLIAVDSTDAGTGWFYFAIDQAPEIHAPLALAYKMGEQISIPVHIAGFPDEMEIIGGYDDFNYDPIAKQINGTLPTYVEEYQIGLRARNDSGEHEVTIGLFQELTDYAITSPASALGFIGVPFEYELEFANISGNQPVALRFTGLPDGFVAVYQQGVWKIKGTPLSESSRLITISKDPSAGGSYGLSGPFTTLLQLEFVDYTEANLMPEITSPLMANFIENEPFSYQLETSLPVDEFTVSNLPTGLSLNKITGRISGTLTHSNSEELYVSASYSGGKVEGTLYLVPLEQRVVQFLAPPILYAYEGVPFEYALSTSSPVENFQSNQLPGGLNLDWDTGLISGTPTQQGTFETNLWAQSSTAYSPAEMTLTIQVLDPKPLLRVTSPAQASGNQGAYFEYQLKSAPLSVNDIEIDILNLPTGLSFDATTHRVVGVPQDDGPLNASVLLGNNTFKLQFLIENSNPTPEFLSPASAVAKTDNFFYFTFSAHDADYFQIVGGELAPGLDFNTSSGVISGIPQWHGKYSAFVRAYHNGNYTDTSFTLHVLDDPDTAEPLILSPGQIVGKVGETLVYQISSNSSFNSSYNVTGLPSGFQYDASSGIIYGSTNYSLNQDITVQHGNAVADVLLQVNYPDPNETPLLVLSPPSALGEPGQPFEFQIETNAASIGAEIFEFSTEGSWPEGLTLNPDTGRISGTLGEDWSSALNFTVSSSSGDSESSLNIVDASANRPPVITSLGHVTAYQGDYLEYFFELENPNTELVVKNNTSDLSYDSIQHRLYGYLVKDSQFEIEFELNDPEHPSWSTVGTISFQVFDSSMRPDPIVTSKLAPVAEKGQYFSYQFEFSQADSQLTMLNTSEEWLQQTGPTEISGIIPESGVGSDLQIYFEYGVPYSYNTHAEMTLHISEPNRAPVVTSPAAATAYLYYPFSYQLQVAPVRESDTINVTTPSWASYDPETMQITGMPESIGYSFIEVSIDTASDTYSSHIRIWTSPEQPRPIVMGNSPAPGFQNVPFILPFSIEGIYYSLDYNLGENYSINASNTALVGVPNGGMGEENGQFWLGGDSNDSSAQFSLRYFDSAPVIIEQPVSIVSNEGGKAYFKAEYGGQAFSEQWFKDDTLHAQGAPYIEFDSVTLANQGEYALHLSNPIGEAISQTARLTVGTPKKLRDWTIAQVGELIDLQPGGEPSESWSDDGVSNLMKWSMGLPLDVKVNEALVSSDYVEGGLQLDFMRNQNAEDVTLLVERSETLAADSWQPIARRLAGGSWQTLRETAAVTESGSGSTRQVTVRDSTVSECGFLRVRVLQESE